eukprot:scaffold294561_cov25-Prasinocladus_malaysianus.AAC.1
MPLSICTASNRNVSGGRVLHSQLSFKARVVALADHMYFDKSSIDLRSGYASVESMKAAGLRLVRLAVMSSVYYSQYGRTGSHYSYEYDHHYYYEYP